MSTTFALDAAWRDLMGAANLRPAEVLRHAGLAEDLLQRARPSVDPDAFARLFDALDEAGGVHSWGLRLGQLQARAAASPVQMAFACSSDLASAAQRLAQFKSMIAPVKWDIHDMIGGLELTLVAEGGLKLPAEYVAGELVFIVQMARHAMGRPVKPIAIEMQRAPTDPDYAMFFGHSVNAGPFNRLVFAPKDASSPFRPPDPELFNAFDPDLQPRLDALSSGAGATQRVCAVLMEALPAGRPEVAYVSKRLGTTPRTLQRRLTSEGASFQAVLRGLRERLARFYLATTDLSGPDIAFLLGYDDPNSFIRAFHGWAGKSPEAYRASEG